jgi:aminoglycoside phosphotransferase family enzyme/predicted kinase
MAPAADPAAIAETHISVVTFIGDRAYKLKKPVKTGFLDFSTRELREKACQREVELNRRLAPDVYLGVADVLLDGAPVDHLVVMRRMPAARRLRVLLGQPDVDDALRAIARQIAAFHQAADRSPAADQAATAPALLDRWEASVADLRRFTGGGTPVLREDEVDAAAARARSYLWGRAPLFDERIADGRACDGHGDLQCDDVFVLDDGPRILDCIEFADEYRWGDVLADVAFLAMDLERLGHPELGRAFLDHYLELSGDRWPQSLEHHHIAYRAHVRAKVACLRHEQGDGHARAAAHQLHALALRHLELGTVRLVLVGGLPGTGKSTLARELGLRLGAVVLSTDELRKDLAGLDRTADASAPPHEGLYAPDNVGAVYDELLREAAALVSRGETVVLDASWTSAEMRSAARSVAADNAAELRELRCVAPASLTAERMRQRRARHDDASDADEDVARALAAEADPWPEATTVDTAHEPAAVAERAMSSLAPGTSDPAERCAR